jgi:hypothetical protein
MIEPVLLRWLAKASLLGLEIAALLGLLIARLLRLLEVRELQLVLSKACWLRLQSGRKYRVDTTRWRALLSVASISRLLWRKRWLI